MNQLYYSFSQYLKNKYNKKVYKICIDAGFTCPNRDGSKGIRGCIYCNNDAFTSTKRNNIEISKLKNINSYNLPSIEEQIKEAKKKLKNKYKAEGFILYFQPYTNTYGKLNILKKLYDYVYCDDDIIGLSIGTRPDCVNEEIIKLIASYANNKEVWIEYGLESANDETLKIINRKHNLSDFIKAIELTRQYEIKICVHIIFGLPYETYKDMLNTVKLIAELPIHAVKFHPLHIVKGSILGDYGWQEGNKWYAKIPNLIFKNLKSNSQRKNFTINNIYNIVINLLSIDEYVKIICDALLILPKNIIIQRLTGEANPNLLIAPDWINKKNLILQKINDELIKKIK